MIVTLQLLENESLPDGFAKFILGSGPSYERKYHQEVPKMELRLMQNGKQYSQVGGFWLECLQCSAGSQPK